MVPVRARVGSVAYILVCGSLVSKRNGYAVFVYTFGCC